jgi:hypothetical protein
MVLTALTIGLFITALVTFILSMSIVFIYAPRWPLGEWVLVILCILGITATIVLSVMYLKPELSIPFQTAEATEYLPEVTQSPAQYAQPLELTMRT